MTRPEHGAGWPTLDAAYRRAIYRIDGDPPQDLVLEKFDAVPCPISGADTTGIFITGCNPHSRRLRPAANARRQRALQRAIHHLGHACLTARALDPQGFWPEEPSFWVPGLSLEQGRVLARRFGQNAFVACDRQGVAHLVWVVRRTAPAAG